MGTTYSNPIIMEDILDTDDIICLIDKCTILVDDQIKRLNQEKEITLLELKYNIRDPDLINFLNSYCKQLEETGILDNKDFKLWCTKETVTGGYFYTYWEYTVYKLKVGKYNEEESKYLNHIV